jgi:hypothetical protein
MIHGDAKKLGVIVADGCQRHSRLRIEGTEGEFGIYFIGIWVFLHGGGSIAIKISSFNANTSMQILQCKCFKSICFAYLVLDR